LFAVDMTIAPRASAAASATPASPAALAEERSGLYRYSVRDALTASQRRPLVASRMAARPG
jgi:hypothetical protein